MFLGLFKDAVSWFAGLSEAAVAIAAVLFIGLLVGMTGFWLLSRLVKKLEGPTTELDSYEDEGEESECAEVGSICPDEDSPTSNRPT